MSKTYIAPLQERYIEKRSDGEEWLQMPVNVSGHELTIKTVIPLTPYTEPDLDAIRKEAYKDGREAGIKDGMCEAWEAARKIVHLQWDGAWAGVDEVEKWFDTYTASEAIEKIRQHEQEQDERIDSDKNKVEALANDIGIHKLFALVKEIRGE